MRVSIVACSGRELASLEADASWKRADVRAALPPAEASRCKRSRVLLGQLELSGNKTLAELGLAEGATLTMVAAAPLRIVTACDSYAKLWCAASGSLVHELAGHSGGVSSVALSPDGLRVVTSSHDSTARLWSVATGDCEHALQGHTGGVNVAAFSADGQLVLTASDDCTARCWSATSGECWRTLEGHSGALGGSAEFSPDGLQALTLSTDGTARLWSVKSGENLHVLGGALISAAFSKSGSRVLTATAWYCKLWSAVSGECLRRIDGFAQSAVALSPDGTLLMTAHESGQVLFHATSGERQLQLDGHARAVAAAAFSPDGRTAATASHDGSARLWCAATGRCLHTLVCNQARATPVGGSQGSCSENRATAVVFSPDGLEVLTTSCDGTMRLWSASSGECLLTVQCHDEEVSALAFG